MDFYMLKQEYPDGVFHYDEGFRRGYELYYVMTGHNRILVDDVLYDMEPGDAALIGPDQIRRDAVEEPGCLEYAAVSCTAGELEAMAGLCGSGETYGIFDGRKIRIAVEAREYMQGLLDRMKKETSSGDAYTQLSKKTILYELLIFLARQDVCREAPAKLTSAESAVMDAVRYIYEHFVHGTTLDEMAARVHMSPAYFSRKFKAVTGFGYKEYGTAVRIRAASHLLLETKQSVSEVAENSGFGDGNYFGDAFKKAMGLSPRMYRKQGGYFPHGAFSQ